MSGANVATETINPGRGLGQITLIFGLFVAARAIGHLVGVLRAGAGPSLILNAALVLLFVVGIIGSHFRFMKEVNARRSDEAGLFDRLVDFESTAAIGGLSGIFFALGYPF